MYICGSGFDHAVQLKITDFKVSTKLALKWEQASNGDWYATDRGANNDYYESEISILGRYSDISDVSIQINNNRVNGSNELYAYDFVSDEKIFGADIDYQYGLNVTVIDYPDIEQKSLNVFNSDIKFRLLKPFIFTGTATMPSLSLAQVGYDGKVQKHTINKYDSYNGTFNYIDSVNDAGIFKGTFIFKNFTETGANELANLRRYHATQRGANFTISNIPGVYWPFGPNGMSYPIECRLKSISNERRFGLHYMLADLELINYKVRNAVV